MTMDFGTITDGRIWLSPVAADGPVQPRPALFLDRDGVLVEEVNYLHRVADVRLQPGAAELVRWANGLAIPVVVVTNQSGIDRGMFGWPEFEAVQQEIAGRLAAEGAKLDMTLACPYHPAHTPDWGQRHAYWRKPGSGLLDFAAKRLNLLQNSSWMVGDNESDVAAAKAAGLAGAVHVLTGHGVSFREAALSMKGPEFAVLPADNLEKVLPLLQSRFVAGQ
jgi:D-glycero-D-manno-heptose 1,7-bisphosphate phosphatase